MRASCRVGEKLVDHADVLKPFHGVVHRAGERCLRHGIAAIQDRREDRRLLCAEHDATKPACGTKLSYAGRGFAVDSGLGPFRGEYPGSERSRMLPREPCRGNRMRRLGALHHGRSEIGWVLSAEPGERAL